MKDATREGAVVVYTNVEASLSGGLLRAFSAKYPGIRVDYNDLGSNGMYNRTVSEAAAGQVTGDIVWGSSMDLQMQLALDNLLDPIDVPNKLHVPEWGNYQNLLLATTIEPLAIIFNKALVAEADVPNSRAELIALMKSGKVDGKIATSNPTKGSAFLYHSYDERTSGTYWDLMRAFSGAKGKTYDSASAIRETVISGENALAFNVVGSYALNWAKAAPNLGVAFEQDSTVAFSRLISQINGAPHPQAARLFIDFVLSQEGQEALAQAGLPSIRDDVKGGFNFTSINERVGGNLKPILLGDDLKFYMEKTNRQTFVAKWNETVK